MSNAFLDSLEKRHSYYGLGKDIAQSKEEIQALVQRATSLTPSAFHSQAGRLVILLDKEHTRFWDIVTNTLKKIVPPENFANTQAKMDDFSGSAGTILFFEEMATIKALQENFPVFKDNFPVWSQHQNAMLQLVVWTALENEGLGASLQHYNPLVDDETKETWSLPATWQLVAQMPFGKITGDFEVKDKLPIEERVFVY
jgi:predicted oxidoreductase (fatty acid repression mutant protein)